MVLVVLVAPAVSEASVVSEALVAPAVSEALVASVVLAVPMGTTTRTILENGKQAFTSLLYCIICHDTEKRLQTAGRFCSQIARLVYLLIAQQPHEKCGQKLLLWHILHREGF